MGRVRGQAACAAGQAPFVPRVKDVASIDHSLGSARKTGPMELALCVEKCAVDS